MDIVSKTEGRSYIEIHHDPSLPGVEYWSGVTDIDDLWRVVKWRIDKNFEKLNLSVHFEHGSRKSVSFSST